MKMSLLACLVLACLPQDKIQTHETAHYQIVAEGYDAKEAGLLLEELHKQLAAHFGKQPSEKQLKIDIRPTREKWIEAMKKDGLPELNAGGFYSPQTKKAYLFRQPSEYFTRQLILHEATHQFHYLATTGNNDPAGFWYREGIAEYFGMHNWDGAKLKTGVVPAVTLEDYPAKALAHLDALKGTLDGWIGGTEPCDRPESWALIHFLIKNHPAEFKETARLLDQRQDPLKSWQRGFGKITPEFTKRFREWIEKNAQPLKIVYVSWQQWGDAIEGKSDSSALAVLKKTPAKLVIEVEGRAGIVFGFVSPQDYKVLRIADKKASIGGESKEITGDKVVVTLECANGKWRIDVNGAAFTPVEAKGEAGFQVEKGRALFRIRP